MVKQIALIGYDLETLELLESLEWVNLIGYVDRKKVDEEELTYLGNDDKFLQNIKKDINVVVSVDSPKVRATLFDVYKEHIDSPIVHNTSYISKRADVGIGTIVQANVLISANVKIGNGCFLNHSSKVHHESKIGDFTILAPNSLVLGRVLIGSNCYIGAGSIIKENVIIGSNVIIGAGSIVLNNIPDNSTVVGNPAKKYLG